MQHLFCGWVGMWQTVPGISILPRHVISLDKSCRVVLIPWHTALAGYAARYGYHLHIITGLLVYTHSTQAATCVRVRAPPQQSISPYTARLWVATPASAVRMSGPGAT